MTEGRVWQITLKEREMNMKKTLTAALLLGSANVLLATPFGPGTDLGTLNDYYYYRNKHGECEYKSNGYRYRKSSQVASNKR